MKNTTFVSYLSDYVYKLSFAYTTNIAVLAQEVQNDNCRLKEPMVLYALFSSQTKELLQSTENEELKREYEDLFDTYDCTSMEFALQNHSKNLNEDYHKVWEAYQCYLNMPGVENRVKGLMRDKINQLQTQYGFTTNWLCEKLDLSVNILTTWLVDGDNATISVDAARKAWHYVEDTMCA